MIYLELFLNFLKVGCFTFGGGYASIPLIRDIVLTHGWLDEEMLTYMIAVSESTPGPIMVNLATYVGISQAGIVGALLATLAVVLPSFIIILLVTAVMAKALKNPYVRAFLGGVKPCIVGIILVTGVWMMGGNLFLKNGAAGNAATAVASVATADYVQWLSRIDSRAVIITLFLILIYFGSRWMGSRDSRANTEVPHNRVSNGQLSDGKVTNGKAINGKSANGESTKRKGLSPIALVLIAAVCGIVGYGL
ncbi:MAG: chromate transporter [Lachnospiraceae bacterium]|nr:chromate transporter [Lachnospiraceae bacterium]